MGTDVDVNPDPPEVWAGIAIRLALTYPDSARNSSSSFCNHATASTNSTLGDRVSSRYSSSGGHPDWVTSGYSSSGGHPDRASITYSSSRGHPDRPSVTSLPEETLFCPSGPNRGHLRGVPHRAPSFLTFLSTSAPVTTRAPARRLRLWDGWNRPANVESIPWKNFRVFQAIKFVSATKIRLGTWPRMPISHFTVSYIHPKITIPCRLCLNM